MGKLNGKTSGKITFNGTSYHNGSNADELLTLIDNNVHKHTSYGCLITGNPNSHFKFTVYNHCNLWAYGENYSDSGGRTPTNLYIYGKNEDSEKFDVLITQVDTQSEKWYKLCSGLKPGEYQIKSEVGNYNQLTEVFVEILDKYVINIGNKFFTYIDNRLTEIQSHEFTGNMTMSELPKKLPNISEEQYTVIKIKM